MTADRVDPEPGGVFAAVAAGAHHRARPHDHAGRLRGARGRDRPAGGRGRSRRPLALRLGLQRVPPGQPGRDRRRRPRGRPARARRSPFAAGCVLFAIGLVAGGLAPTMPLLVLARVVQGLGAGVVPRSRTRRSVGAIPRRCGRGCSRCSRPRGSCPRSPAPRSPGSSRDAFGWRWVFLGLVPLVAHRGRDDHVPALAAHRSGAGRTTRTRTPRPRTSRQAAKTSDAVLVAVGAGLVIGGLTASELPWLMPVLVGARRADRAARPFVRLVPRGNAAGAAGSARRRCWRAAC